MSADPSGLGPHELDAEGNPIVPLDAEGNPVAPRPPDLDPEGNPIKPGSLASGAEMPQGGRGG